MSKKEGLFLAVVWAVTIATFEPGLHGQFFFDDVANVMQIESLRLRDLSLVSLQEAWNSGIAGPSGRPLAQISFALNQYFGGIDPFSYKAVNLAIHLINGVLAYFFSRRLLGSPLSALVIATIWLLHPIQITSVLYVVQRMTSLSALFVLLGLILHIRGRDPEGSFGTVYLLLAWFVCWPLSFLSKETGALFPLFVLVWELTLKRSVLGQLDRFALYLVITIGLVCLASLIYLVLPSGQWLWAGYAMRSFTLSERLLTEGRVLWFYLGLIAFPRLEAFGLYHDDMLLSTGLLSPWTTLLAWSGLLILGWVAWGARQRAPLLSFGIAWFLVGHLLESTVLPLEIAHEHRNYLPSFGIFIAGAWGVRQMVKCPGWQKTLGIALVSAFAFYSELLTILRANQYSDEIRRTRIESQYHPASARTHYEAGMTLVSRGKITSINSPQYFFARKHYERAGEIEPNFKLSWLGLIHLNCMVGAPVESAWIEELVSRLHRSPFSPGDRNVLFNVKEMAIAGSLCLSRAQTEKLFDAAESNVTVSLSVRSLLYSWFADYLTLAVHDLLAAQVELDKSLAITPHNSSNLIKRAQLAFLQGRHEEAREILDRIGDVSLVRADREMLVLLRNCLGPEGKIKCVGK